MFIINKKNLQIWLVFFFNYYLKFNQLKSINLEIFLFKNEHVIYINL